ncbi:MAG: hypothetical protein Q4G34_01815 [Micrococcus sp.]|nr:hypothetical protein [Micrococcus sp.]
MTILPTAWWGDPYVSHSYAAGVNTYRLARRHWGGDASILGEAQVRDESVRWVHPASRDALGRAFAAVVTWMAGQAGVMSESRTDVAASLALPTVTLPLHPPTAWHVSVQEVFPPPLHTRDARTTRHVSTWRVTTIDGAALGTVHVGPADQDASDDVGKLPVLPLRFHAPDGTMRWDLEGWVSRTTHGEVRVSVTDAGAGEERTVLDVVGSADAPPDWHVHPAVSPSSTRLTGEALGALADALLAVFGAQPS